MRKIDKQRSHSKQQKDCGAKATFGLKCKTLMEA
jgi:hypothetical protein